MKTLENCRPSYGHAVEMQNTNASGWRFSRKLEPVASRRDKSELEIRTRGAKTGPNIEFRHRYGETSGSRPAQTFSARYRRLILCLRSMVIARIFVAANGGTLTAHSGGPGCGTTMSIRLPVAVDLSSSRLIQPDLAAAAASSHAQAG